MVHSKITNICRQEMSIVRSQHNVIKYHFDYSVLCSNLVPGYRILFRGIASHVTGSLMSRGFHNAIKASHLPSPLRTQQVICLEKFFDLSIEPKHSNRMFSIKPTFNTQTSKEERRSPTRNKGDHDLNYNLILIKVAHIYKLTILMEIY